jgi:hypothetical protein
MLRGFWLAEKQWKKLQLNWSHAQFVPVDLNIWRENATWLLIGRKTVKKTTIKLVARSICSRRFENLAGKCYVASDWPKNSEKNLLPFLAFRVKKPFQKTKAFVFCNAFFTRKNSEKK